MDDDAVLDDAEDPDADAEAEADVASDDPVDDSLDGAADADDTALGPVAEAAGVVGSSFAPDEQPATATSRTAIITAQRIPPTLE